MIDVLFVLLMKRACKLPSIHDVHNTALMFILLNHILNYSDGSCSELLHTYTNSVSIN